MKMIKWLLYFILFCCNGILITNYVTPLFKEKSQELKGVYYLDGKIYKLGTSELFTGTLKDTAGFRILEYHVEKGIKNGKYSYYFMNGTPSVIGQMKNNKNFGEWIYYYENGQIECKGNFIDDVPSNKWVWFYKDGKIKEIGWFVNGCKEGNWVHFDYDGKLNIQRSFSKDIMINEIRAERLISI